MMTELRRKDDFGIWRWFRLYPVFVGFFLAAVSVGGYLATVNHLGSKISNVELRQDAQDLSMVEQLKITSRIVALQESMDRRVSRLEKYQDGKRP